MDFSEDELKYLVDAIYGNDCNDEIEKSVFRNCRDSVLSKIENELCTKYSYNLNLYKDWFGETVINKSYFGMDKDKAQYDQESLRIEETINRRGMITLSNFIHSLTISLNKIFEKYFLHAFIDDEGRIENLISTINMGLNDAFNGRDDLRKLFNPKIEATNQGELKFTLMSTSEDGLPKDFLIRTALNKESFDIMQQYLNRVF